MTSRDRAIWVGHEVFLSAAVVVFGLVAAASTSAAGDTASYSKAIDVRATVNKDMTSTTLATIRHKVLKESAIQMLGQIVLSYSESRDTLEIPEAYTEKADGRRIDIDPATILTRDAATGLGAVYQRDAKTKTLIFPDIEVGDTLVYVARTHRFDKRLGEHFVYSSLLSQSVPLTSYRLEVLAPATLDLDLHFKGDGFTHVITDEDGVRRHVIGFAPKPWRQDDPDAVSPWDREPSITITTFKSMEQLAETYWRHMQGKDAVTSEVQALAEDITKGIGDRRAQVEAIDRWVKRNIRYVMVYLGAGGFTPNPASTVLKNRYGDCKDHAAVMSALLKAKNISSEQVLIAMGNSYRLSPVPMPEFNHVMLYVPELGIYTDPTASTAALGVLPTGSYDKPVLHITDAGSRLARTPPMRSEDHVTVSTTKVTVGADGLIKGTTRQVLTGIFASSARQIAGKIERAGRETFAADKLTFPGLPGNRHLHSDEPLRLF